MKSEHPFGEVLTDAQALLEASRCLMCEDAPCVAACPAEVPVKHFIRAIRFESPRRAINLIRQRNVFAGVCGLACPVDELCVGACRSTDLSTPIAIGRLQHYAAVKDLQAGRAAPEKALAPAKAPPGEPVAGVGGGPSGLAAAAELAKLGLRPTVFEKRKLAGGICTYSVPGHRLPHELVAAEIDCIVRLGVRVEGNWSLGDSATLDGLFSEGYAAVYLAMGLQEAAVPALSGSDLKGVLTWRHVLDGGAAHRLGEGGKPTVPAHVVIVGGGSVAMDVATTVLQLGATDVDLVCLEGPSEMPAYHDELDEAWDAGVRMHGRAMPLELTGSGGAVTGLRAVRIRWKEPGKFVPSNAVPIAGTEFWLPGSMVVFAIGARPSPGLRAALPGVQFDDAGRIVVDTETQATSRPGVFAGGDLASGGGMTIVKAVAEGRRAAQSIAAHLSHNKASGPV